MSVEKPGDYELRRPEPAQLEELSDLYFDLRKKNDLPIVPGYFKSLPDSTFKETWQSLFNDPGRYKARILYIEGDVAGFVKVGKGYWSEKLPREFQDAMRGITIPGRTGELHQIYVKAQHIGRGFGRILYGAGREDLRALGYKNLLVGTYKANARAVAFYERQGAKIVSDRVWDVEVGQRHFYIPSVFLLHSHL